MNRLFVSPTRFRPLNAAAAGPTSALQSKGGSHD